jgi:methionyl aminopeptidase
LINYSSLIDSFSFFLSDHADKYGYGVVQQFVGHGVGRVFHADPVILHFSN